MGYCNLIKKTKTDGVVSLSQAKDQLNVDKDYYEDDQHIGLLIESATSLAEDYTGRDIALTDCELEYIDFNSSYWKIEEVPLYSFTSLTKTVDDVETVLEEGTDFEIQTTPSDFIIRFNEALEADKLAAVFKTGYDTENVPRSIIQAILIQINDLYDVERTSHVVGTNFRSTNAFERKLDAYVVIRW